jgi:hypothetical protein
MSCGPQLARSFTGLGGRHEAGHDVRRGWLRRLRLSRADCVWLLTWLAVGVVLYMAETALIARLWIFALPIYFAHAIVGFVLLLVWTFRPIADPSYSFRPAGVLLACAVAMGVSLNELRHAGDVLHFAWEKPRYDVLREQALASTLQGSDYPWGLMGEVAGVDYRVDAGRPTRMAIEWIEFIPDGWGGVVWDPTGLVGQARGWRRENGRIRSTAPPEAESLFGGGLVWCRPLWDGYYRCAFS